MAGNYRPISILHTLAKVVEKLVSKQIINFLDKHNQFSSTQFGFRKNSTTEDALNYMMEQLYDNLNKRLSNILIMIDLAKAFDTVSHSILLEKLAYYGFRGIVNRWFSSYLSERKHYIVVDDIKSSQHNVNCGVPQGSVLGPLLFLIYINDFNECHQAKSIQFADDTSVLVSHNSAHELKVIANLQLFNIHKWLIANKLSVNVNKCCYLTISNKKINTELNLCMNDTSITKVQHARLLGVIIDETLSFKKHIESISRKVACAIYSLRKIRHLISQKIATSIYYTIIFPHLHYCITIWGNKHSYLLHTLLLLQKRAVRTICCPGDFLAHTDHLFRRLGMLKIEDLFKYFLSIYMYKITHRLTPHILSEIIAMHQHTHVYNTRTCNAHIRTPQFALSCAQRVLSFSCPKRYNSLPSNLKEISNIKRFKLKLKQHILLN